MSEEAMTLEATKDLNNKITIICDQYAKRNCPEIIDDSKRIIPEIQRFATWFLNEPEIGVPEDQKAYMNTEVVRMLKDITQAIEKNDSVLMFDALECGIAEYLRLFIPEEDFEDE